MKRFFLLCFVSLHALPIDLTIVNGAASLESSQSAMVITTSDRAILEWKSFSIGATETLRFLQSSENAAVLNRVIGSEMSELMGVLSANGQVYLINPNGILVGPEGRIDTASFFASCLDLENGSFLAGGEIQFKGSSNGTIQNLGNIEAPGGKISLIAHKIEQDGIIRSREVSLLAAHEVLLQPSGQTVLQIRPALPAEGVVSEGYIEALKVQIETDGIGSVLLKKESFAGSLDLVKEGSEILIRSHRVGLEGQMNASKISIVGSSIASEASFSAQAPEGEISLAAEGIKLEGTLEAKKIALQADEKPLYLLGRVDVSGDEGGMISIQGPKCFLAGSLLAEGREGSGGDIDIHCSRAWIETASGKISTNGKTAGGREKIEAGTFFSSGTHYSNGEEGGSLSLKGEIITLCAATLSAGGNSGRIEIRSNNLFINGYTRLEANGSSKGGSICLYGDKLLCNGLATAIGDLPGTVLIDPQNLIIDQTSGIFPQYELLDPNPLGGTGFGTDVTVLPNGNVVVTKPFDDFGGMNAGAIHLYNDLTAALISSLTGSSSDDQVGGNNGSPTPVLANGNFITYTPFWDNGGAMDAGAVTWGNMATGFIVSGPVSTSNSFLGTFVNDQLGLFISPLPNGNFIFSQPSWNTFTGIAVLGVGTTGKFSDGTIGYCSASNSIVGSAMGDAIGSILTILPSNSNFVTGGSNWNGNAGAVTWASGTTGRMGDGNFGVVSASNSLIGMTANDFVGQFGVEVVGLGNNFVIRSPQWDDWQAGGTMDVGAVTFGNGTNGQFGNGGFGPITSTNSIVGTTPSDQIGSAGITVLNNGHFVIASTSWDNVAMGATDAGAVTWANGNTGQPAGGFGSVSASNSIIGSSTNDFIGQVTALNNSNFVVSGSNWNMGTGIAGLCNGTTGRIVIGNSFGAISGVNALIGAVGDNVASGGVFPLTPLNHFIVLSPIWSGGLGAVTWGDGAMGISGPIGAGNSFLGTIATDNIGFNGPTPTVLPSGNYLIYSPLWTDPMTGIANVGAVTWGNGSNGQFSPGGFGPISQTNSFVGTIANEVVGGTAAVVLLVNGNFVIPDPNYQNGFGAAAWGNGSNGHYGNGPNFGQISATNSIVGGQAGDNIGSLAISTLTNGNYVVVSHQWHDPLNANRSVGAVTWGNGSNGAMNTGLYGLVSQSNSVVGSSAGDQFGIQRAAFFNGNFVAGSAFWDNGAMADVGILTWINGSNGLFAGGTGGQANGGNSIIGAQPNDRITSGNIIISLSTGNYVIQSPNWHFGGAANAGAVSFISGIDGTFLASGMYGAVSTTNSFYGTNGGDLVGGGGSASIDTGGYMVINNSAWMNGANPSAGAALWVDPVNGADLYGNTSGAISVQNSIAGQGAFTNLSTAYRNTVYNTFHGSFVAEGAGRVRVGIYDPNALTFARAQGQDITVIPAFLTQTLNTGTAVVLQANNDITISSPIIASAGGAGGNLTFSAGRSVFINADITTDNGNLNIIGNDLLSSGVINAFRQAGSADIAIGPNVTLNSGTGSMVINLLDGAGKTNSASGDVLIDMNATLIANGSGSITVNAQINNIQINPGALLQTQNGDLFLSAGTSLFGNSGPATLQIMGSGNLTLLVDNLFPTPPTIGAGLLNIPDLTLTTSGGLLKIYAGAFGVSTFPPLINGTAFSSSFETMGIYFPNGTGGVPYAIFYKTGFPIPVPPVTLTNGLVAFEISTSETFQRWELQHNETFFDLDRYAPSWTPKGLNLSYPSLISPWERRFNDLIERRKR